MKKPSLADALKPLDRTAAVLPQATGAAPRKPAAARTPSREGKATVIGYFSPECVLQLKQLGLDRGGMTQQALLTEALNDLFQKYRKPTLA